MGRSCGALLSNASYDTDTARGNTLPKQPDVGQPVVQVCVSVSNGIEVNSELSCHDNSCTCWLEAFFLQAPQLNLCGEKAEGLAVLTHIGLEDG